MGSGKQAMSRSARLFALAGLLVWSAQAIAEDWVVRPAEGARGETLIFGADRPQSYRFECASDAVIVTQTGVTGLKDLRTGKAIGDSPDAVMPQGAAMMALFGGKGDPAFLPASSANNPAGGWDLAIRLPKGDKQLKAVGKSEMISLFTTGETMAVPMDKASRSLWSDFLRRCQAAG